MTLRMKNLETCTKYSSLKGNWICSNEITQLTSSTGYNMGIVGIQWQISKICCKITAATSNKFATNCPYHISGNECLDEGSYLFTMKETF